VNALIKAESDHGTADALTIGRLVMSSIKMSHHFIASCNSRAVGCNVKTIEYLKADFLNKAAIEADSPRSVDEKDERGRVKDERKMDLFRKAFLKVRERFAGCPGQ
jgi:hypothetical protein